MTEIFARDLPDPVASTAFHGRSHKQMSMNAAHIVKCVNTHDELITALNGALAAIRLGKDVDQEAALRYGIEVLIKASSPDGGKE